MPFRRRRFRSRRRFARRGRRRFVRRGRFRRGFRRRRFGRRSLNGMFRSFPYRTPKQRWQLNTAFRYTFEFALPRGPSYTANAASSTVFRFDRTINNINYSIPWLPYQVFKVRMDQLFALFNFWRLNCVVVKFVFNWPGTSTADFGNLAAGGVQPYNYMVPPADYPPNLLGDGTDTYAFTGRNYNKRFLQRMYWFTEMYPGQATLPSEFNWDRAGTTMSTDQGQAVINEDQNFPNKYNLKFKNLQVGLMASRKTVTFKLKRPTTSQTRRNLTNDGEVTDPSRQAMGWMENTQTGPDAVPWFSRPVFYLPKVPSNQADTAALRPINCQVQMKWYCSFAGRTLV